MKQIFIIYISGKCNYQIRQKKANSKAEGSNLDFLILQLSESSKF